MSEPVRIKRIYTDVAVKPEGEGYGVFLDDRQTRTARGAPLIAPTQGLAVAIAGEWDAQGEFIDRQTMPLTALLSAVLGAGDAGVAEWRAEVVNYLGSDLICYRAETPAVLVERQKEIWDPYISWLRQEFGAGLVVTSGITAVAQPDEAIEPIRRALNELAPPTLFGIYTGTRIIGSAVLALALFKEFRPASDIFEASRLDEHFQEEAWGVDAEAKAREDRLRQEFSAVAAFMRLLKKA